MGTLETGLPLPHGPAPSPLRSSKAFLLSSHGPACKRVATVPNLKAIELPRPRKQFLGGTAHPACLPAVTVRVYLRLARAKQPTEEGGKGQREAGHTYHAQMMGAHLGLPHFTSPLTSLCTLLGTDRHYQNRSKT